ncbi:hypothetical protein B0H19DRAFT_1070707 [Mycena capillaripes]|nr:hypothetical protein B0H19DRAFT_1070707 [Mycena capillaripes]
MQSTISCSVALALFLLLVLMLLAKGTSVCTILEDEVAYQESEICRLEKLVKKSHSLAGLEEECRHLRSLVSRHQGDVAYMKSKVKRLQEALRGTKDLHDVAELAEIRLEELSAQVEEQKACIQDLRARYHAERTERAVADTMNWAMEKEREELQQTIKDLRKTSQDAVHQSSVCEVRQAAVIKTMQHHIKTAARLSVEQETKIRRLEEQISAAEDEKNEVVLLAEIVMKAETAVNDQKSENRRNIKNLKKKWAAAWELVAGEMREMRSRLGELKEVADPDASFVSVVHLFEGRDNEEDVDDEMADMSMCSVLHDMKTNPMTPTNARAPRLPRLPWVISPSKLANRRLVRKISLSANPPDSPFAFATNAVQFAPTETKYTKDRSAKRVKVDRMGL